MGKIDPKNLRSGPPDLPEMFRKNESNQRDRGRGDHPRAAPMHDISWLRTSENGKMDQAVDRVSRAMAGR